MSNRPTIAKGSRGADVKALQQLLGIKADGIFGRNTERAVEIFQTDNDLYVDGIVGPISWSAVETCGTASPKGLLDPWTKVKVTKYKSGYASFTLRRSTADKLDLVIDKVYGAGGVLTSSGGRRSLSAAVGSNRSKTSLHYTGRAFDLYLWSGMIKPQEDPFVVTLDDKDRSLWRVYVACEDAPMKEVTAWTYNREQISVRRRLLDFTALLRKHEFSRIPARRSFFSGGSRGAAEWWHFQDISGLVHGESKFGDELQKVWPTSSLTESPVWKYRDYVWKNYGFSRS
jgi:hypothetical protein